MEVGREIHKLRLERGLTITECANQFWIPYREAYDALAHYRSFRNRYGEIDADGPEAFYSRERFGEEN
jgi:hypothetical protein